MSRVVVQPNEDIDKAVKAIVKTIGKDTPPDVACNIIKTAIMWEKTKFALLDSDDSFDPDSM